jgi:Ni,Fe-hydrogenase III component G
VFVSAGQCPSAILQITRPNRAWITVNVEELPALAKWLKEELGYYHCSTVTGLDSGEVFEVLYHLSAGAGELTVRFAVPRANPHFPTMTGVWPGAILYERELQDMFGLVVNGHPDPRRYVLPEDWPDDIYPLRKDYVYTYQEAPPAKRE